MSSTKHKACYAITSADTDMFSRLKTSSLTNFLIQSAISSAEELGFGFSDLRKENLFWVLNRLTIEIYRPIKWSEKIEVETWPKNVERIFYLRDFIVRDEHQNIVAKATSAWLAIDLKSKRPGNFNKDKMEVFTRLKNIQALDYAPEKLGEINGLTINEVTSSYFDIDLNKHVTSTRYIDWMMDSYGIDFHEKNYPKSLSINYMKEAMLNETIEIKTQSESQTHCFEGYNKQQEKVAFRGKIQF